MRTEELIKSQQQLKKSIDNNSNKLLETSLVYKRSTKKLGDISLEYADKISLDFTKNIASLGFSIEGAGLSLAARLTQAFKNQKDDITGEKKPSLLKEFIRTKEKSKMINDLVSNFMLKLGIVEKQLQKIPDIINFEDELMKMNRSLGISGERSKLFLDNIVDVSNVAAKMNVGINDLVKMQTKYNDIMGTSVALRESDLFFLSEMSQVAGQTVESVAEMTANMRLFGYNGDVAHRTIADLVDLSDKYTVNAKLVTEDFIKNFEKAQEFKFKDGVEGLAKMVADSKFMKINVTDTFESAKGFRTLEGSFEKVAKLQLLGGEFSKADPFRLMHLARTNVPEFQKQIMGMFGDIGKLNEVTGEIEFSALDLDRLSQAQQLVGGQVGDIQKMITQQRRLEIIQSKNNSLTENQAKMIANLATFDEKGITIQTKSGEIKKLEELNNKNFKLLLDDNLDESSKKLGDRVLGSQSLKEFSEVTDKFNLAYASTSTKVIEGFKQFANDINDGIFNKLKDLGFSERDANIRARAISQEALINEAATITERIGNTDKAILEGLNILSSLYYQENNKESSTTLGEAIDKVKNLVNDSSENILNLFSSAMDSDMRKMELNSDNIKLLAEKLGDNEELVNKINTMTKQTPKKPDTTSDISEGLVKQQNDVLEKINKSISEKLPEVIKEAMTTMSSNIAFDPLTLNINVQGDIIKISKEVVRVNPKLKNSG